MLLNDMHDAVIEVRDLSKAYRLGQTAGLERTFRELIYGVPRALARRLGRARPSADAHEILWALRGASFDVKRGEVLGIIGANGAGKSTLLKVLSEITDPTEGTAVVRGRVASLLEVGTGFHPELTGGENIFLNGAILGMTRREIRRKFDAIVDFAGVEAFIDTPVKRYSSGMRVRLAFAVAAHLDPEILIIDEVLAVGDAAFQDKCLGKMQDITTGEGRTVLFVSHNMAAVQRLCSRAIRLERGRIVDNTDPATAVQHYLDQSTRHDAGANVAIEHLPRHDGMGQLVRFTDCQILNAAGDPTTQLRFGEPFSVELQCIGCSRMDHVSFVVGIESPTQGRIATTMSEERIEEAAINPGQRMRARLAVSGLPLVPGQYAVTIGIRSIKGGVDHVPHARTFQVTGLLADAAQSPNGRDGLLRVEPDWQMETLRTDETNTQPQAA